MGLVKVALLLDDAVLTGGAEIVAAGGGLPRRVSMEAARFYGVLGSYDDVAAGHLPAGVDGSRDAQPFLHVDGSLIHSYWGLGGAAGEIRRQRPNSEGGGFVWRLTTHRCLGMAYSPLNAEVFIATGFDDNKVYVLDADTGAVKRSWAWTGSDQIGRLWYDEQRDELFAFTWRSDGNFVVYDRLGVVKRSGTSGVQADLAILQVGMVNDDIAILQDDRGEIRRFNRTTLALIDSITGGFAPSGQGAPDHRTEYFPIAVWSHNYFAVSADRTKLFAFAPMGHDIIEIDPLTHTAIILHGGGSLQGAVFRSWGASAASFLGGIAATARWLTVDIDNRVGQDVRFPSQIARVSIQQQTATWSFTVDEEDYPDGVVLRRINVPSHNAGHASLAYRVNAGAWVGFVNEVDGAVALDVGDVLQLRATFDPRVGLGSLSWIGDDAGGGPALLVDDPNASVFVEVPVVGVSGKAIVVESPGGVAVLL